MHHVLKMGGDLPPQKKKEQMHQQEKWDFLTNEVGEDLDHSEEGSEDENKILFEDVDEFEIDEEGTIINNPKQTLYRLIDTVQPSSCSMGSEKSVVSRIGLSLGDKAGMENVDKEKANKIIYEMSKVCTLQPPNTHTRVRAPLRSETEIVPPHTYNIGLKVFSE